MGGDKGWSLEAYKKYAIRAATELYYPKEIIAAINNAQTVDKISCIMERQRKRLIG